MDVTKRRWFSFQFHKKNFPIRKKIPHDIEVHISRDSEDQGLSNMLVLLDCILDGKTGGRHSGKPCPLTKFG